MSHNEELIRKLESQVAQLEEANQALMRDLSAREQEDKTLREHEEKYRQLFTSVSDAVMVFDVEEKRFVDVNPAALRLYGYTREEFLDLARPAIVADPDAETMTLEGIHTGELTYFPLQHHRKKDGTIFPAEVAVGNFKVGGRKLFYNMVRDVTGRVRAEAELRESAARFRAVVQSASDAIVSADQTGRIIFWNQAAEKIFGFTEDEALGQPLTIIVPERYRGDHHQGFERYLETGQPQVIGKTIELHGKTKDGAEIPLELSLATWESRGQPFFTGLLRDISDRRRSEQALRDSEEKYRRLIRMANDAIFIADAETGVILDANQSAEKLIGRPLNEIIGLHQTQIHPPGESERYQEIFQEHVRSGKAITEDLFVRHRDGRKIPVEVSASVVEVGGKKLIQGVFRDITLRREAETALKESEERFRQLSASAFETIAIHENGIILDANPAMGQMFGCEMSEIIGKNALDFAAPESREVVLTHIQEGYEKPYEVVGLRKDGSTFPAEIIGRAIPYKGRMVRVSAIRDITERKKAEDELKRLKEFNENIVQNMSEGILVQDARGDISFINPAAEALLGYEAGELLGKSWTTIVPPDQHTIVEAADRRRRRGRSDRYQVELLRKDGVRVPVLVGGTPRMVDGKFAGNLAVFTDFREQAQRERLQKALLDFAASLRNARTVDEILPLVLRHAVEVVGAFLAVAWLVEPCSGDLVARGWYPPPAPDLSCLRQKKGEGITGLVASTGEFYYSEDLWKDPEAVFSSGEREFLKEVREAISLPLRTEEGTIGVIHFALDKVHSITNEEIHLLTAMTEMASSAIHRAILYEQTGRQLQRLEALHNIDLAITASLDLHVTLDIILSQIVRQLEVDAASVLLLNPQLQVLEYANGRGFRTPSIRSTWIRIGTGQIGRAVLEQHAVQISTLTEIPADFERITLVSGEGFHFYYGVPLIAKGRVKGFLEIFHRSLLEARPEWLNYLETLSGQTAIAIENGLLFKDIQRSNLELTLAYDITLEGWSYALELRDMETEGHSQRVTDLTLNLARAMGVPESDLIHIRRGALLHDIGKMGIPDRILLNPGVLSDEEWEIMRQHPVHAYDLLSPISFLQPALDIPYCHHEKWDGTGYPRGLRETEIPLAARIFAVVDVWDALLSERPYRAACSEQKAKDYLRSQAGIHFDPQVVEAFVEMV